MANLPKGAIVGTSSLRRRAQLLACRPDLQLVDLRGNLETRLRKLREQELQAIVLAAAGLHRLGWEEHITQLLPHDICLPAVGQGALTAEVLDSNTAVLEMLKTIDHYQTRQAVTAERAFLHRVEGGCQTSVGVYSRAKDRDSLEVTAVILTADGSRQLRDSTTGSLQEADRLGEALAEKMLRNGGSRLIRE